MRASLPRAASRLFKLRAASRSLSSYASTQPREAALHRLRVGGVPEHFNAPWHTAAVKGAFEDAALEVAWQDFHGGTGAMMRSLRDGEIDVAIALTEGIVSDMLSGDDSSPTAPVLLGTYVGTPLTWGVHVHSDSDVQCMSQLDGGTRFAVSRMGSGSHLMACVDARARGTDPRALEYEVVGSLNGARDALREGRALAFLWEKFTTKHLVDSGEWRRIGEVPTPWPCFSVAVSREAIEGSGAELLRMLQLVKAEAEELRGSADVARTIGLMFGQQTADVSEWLQGVEWVCDPAVSHSTLEQVMAALVEAGVLETSQLRPPAQLVSRLTADADGAAASA